MVIPFADDDDASDRQRLEYGLRRGYGHRTPIVPCETATPSAAGTVAVNDYHLVNCVHPFGG